MQTTHVLSQDDMRDTGGRMLAELRDHSYYGAIGGMLAGEIGSEQLEKQ